MMENTCSEQVSLSVTFEASIELNISWYTISLILWTILHDKNYYITRLVYEANFVIFDKLVAVVSKPVWMF